MQGLHKIIFKKMSTSNSTETFEALTLILNNEQAFNKVVDTFWLTLDLDANGQLTLYELEAFINSISADMGIKWGRQY